MNIVHESTRSFSSVASELLKALSRAVRSCSADGILLSGGLDSSAVAACLPQRKRAFTVALEGRGPDLEFATLAATHLGLDWQPVSVSIDEALAAIPNVIRVLRSFDPAIPNDLAAYFGIQAARDAECRIILTGDGGDELFAGYGYMHSMPDREMEAYIARLAQSMTFSSKALGNALNVHVDQPFLEAEFMQLALEIPPSLKVRKDGDRQYGKWILRKAVEDRLPRAVVWRAKTPLETGSGMDRLRSIIADGVDDAEFQAARTRTKIQFRDKEHYFYYKVFEREIGAIPPPSEGESTCIGCGAGVPHGRLHCRVCGAYPAVYEPVKGGL